MLAAFGLSLSWLPQHALTPYAARPALERAAVAVCVERQAYRPRGRGSAGAVRNQGARTIVTKLTSLRSRNGAVDMDGMGRLLRGYDIQGPMLLDVLQGLKHANRWEMCQAVARYVEASYAPKRRGAPRTREELPRFQTLSPTDDGEDMDMGQLLAMQGEEAEPGFVPNSFLQPAPSDGVMLSGFRGETVHTRPAASFFCLFVARAATRAT